MKTLNFSTGKLCLFISLFLLMYSCSEDETPEDVPFSIVLEVTDSSIAADGNDRVDFTVRVFDQDDQLISGEDVQIYSNNQVIDGFSFSTSEPGTYQFEARLEDIKSNIVRITALSEQDLKVSSVNLKSNTQVMIADGQSTAKLEVEFKDASGNVLEDVNYLLRANQEDLTSLNFKTTETGQYNLIASVNGIESNTIIIDAREDIQYEEISIPVVFHIVHVGEAVGEGSNFSASDAEALLARINKGLSNDFENDNPNAVDTKIRFRMAKIGEDGNTLSEPGINRIDGRAFDIGSQNRFQENMAKRPDVVYDSKTLEREVFFGEGDIAGDNQFGRNELDFIASETQWDMHFYHNIYLAPLQEDINASGYATYPVMSQGDILEGLPETTSVEQGEKVNSGLAICVVNSNSITYIDGHYTIIHETGHVLGLRHVFSQNNCETSDYCTDTYSYKAGDINEKCADNLGIDKRDNIMDYTPERSNFTYEQRERMRKVLEYAYYLKDLKNSDR